MKTQQNNVAEIKVTYRSKSTEKPKITSSADVYEHAIKLFDTEELELREKFYVMYLNRANQIIGFHHHSTGGITGTVVDVRLIMSIGLKMLATGVILIHNHPTGNLNPSTSDKDLTKQVSSAGKLLDITVFDHVIVTPLPGKYYSFADEGEL